MKRAKERCVQHLLRASPSDVSQAGHPDVTASSESSGIQKNMDLSLTADLAMMSE